MNVFQNANSNPNGVDFKKIEKNYRIFKIPVKLEKKIVDSNVYFAVRYLDLSTKIDFIANNSKKLDLQIEGYVVEKFLKALFTKNSDELLAFINPKDSILLKLGSKEYTNRFYKSFDGYNDKVLEGIIIRNNGYKAVLSGIINGKKKYRLLSFGVRNKKHLYTDSFLSQSDSIINAIYFKQPQYFDGKISELEKNYKWVAESYNNDFYIKNKKNMGFFILKAEPICYKTAIVNEKNLDPIESFFISTKKTLRAKKFDDYLNFFYPESKDRLKKTFTRLNDIQLKAVIENDVSVNYYFKIDLNDFLSIFYYRKNNSKEYGDDYSYVFYDKKKGSYYFSNISIFSSIDKIFRNLKFIKYVDSLSDRVDCI